MTKKIILAVIVVLLGLAVGLFVFKTELGHWSLFQKLQDLGEPYQEILEMRFIDDLSPKEISAVLGVSENVVSVRIHRGMNKLRQLTEKELD